MNRYISLITLIFLILCCSDEMPVHKWRVLPVDIRYDLYDVWGSSTDNIWAIGEWGAIYRFNINNEGQITVTETTSPTNLSLRGISFFKPNRGLSVGDKGTILEYKGVSWQQLPSPTAENLHSVDFYKDDFALAVGENRTILEYDGENWNIIQLDNTDIPIVNLNSISVFTSDFAIAVGNQGIILEFNGIEWKNVETGITNDIDFLDVKVTDEKTAYVCGRDGTLIVRNGDEWSQIESNTTADINALSFYSSQEGWAVCEDGSIIEINGLSTRLLLPITQVTLNGVFSNSKFDAWAVGNMGTVERYY
ncbi:MAG: hypothetical protein DRH49_06080 [Candidatus Coatesbacteria bacterium]|nr:MAG: hypothetical protein DRH49_06080 [Candidatus Coatesbacteria bacterium]